MPLVGNRFVGPPGPRKCAAALVRAWQWPGSLGRRDPGHFGTAHECLSLGREQKRLLGRGGASAPWSMWLPAPAGGGLLAVQGAAHPPFDVGDTAFPKGTTLGEQHGSVAVEVRACSASTLWPLCRGGSTVTSGPRSREHKCLGTGTVYVT